MSNGTIKIDGARFLLTLDPERRIIQDASILIEGQRITRVGKASELQGVEADRVIDATDMVVTPGLINAHLHISYASVTSGMFPDSMDPGDYLADTFRMSLAMTEEEEYYASLLGITEVLKYGTTCFLDPGTTRFLDACMKAYQESGCRIVLGTHVMDRPGASDFTVNTPAEAKALTEEVIRKYDGALDGRVRAWAMALDVDHSSRELLTAIKEVANSHNTGLTLHCVNSPDSVQYHLEKFGKRPIEYLEEIGVLGPNVLLAHVIGLNDAEVDCVARTDTKLVMCPPAATKMGAGTTIHGKLPEMLDKGVCVGLGNDSGNHGSVDTLRTVYLAAILYKDARQNVTAVPAETALEMATIQGARALGLDADIGSIEVGKKADLVLFDTRRPEWRTLFNPVNSLVYNADGRSVHTVIVDGKVVIENHQPVFVNEWKLIQRVRGIGEDLAARVGISYPPSWPIV
ncbi:MAG: amidohydrolase [Dehalococcoidia bacterium]